MENFDVELSDNKSKMTLLSPEIVEIRDKIVDKLEGKSLKDIRSNIKDFLDNEKKEETRLAALAARIVLLRRFISKLADSQELLEKEETIILIMRVLITMITSKLTMKVTIMKAT